MKNGKMTGSVVELPHHQLAAELVGQEERPVGGKGADHGGGEARIQGSESCGAVHGGEYTDQSPRVLLVWASNLFPSHLVTLILPALCCSTLTDASYLQCAQYP